jgi:hypothetical protein
MTSREIHEAVHQALAEVDRRLASAELAAGAAEGGKRAPVKPVKANAA